MNTSVTPFREALESLDRVKADSIFQEVLLELSPIDAVEQVVVPALEQIGGAWDAGSVALSQVYMSGRFCEELVDRTLPPQRPGPKTPATLGHRGAQRLPRSGQTNCVFRHARQRF